MKKTLTIGLDIGNYDVKTQNTTTPSGFVTYDSLPYGVENYMKLNGRYYIPDEQRFSYTKDKTVNDNAIILSLMGIAAEILAEAEKQDKKKREQAEKNPAKANRILGIQGEINELEFINLGVGLPPTHVSALEEKTKNYYLKHFGNGKEYITYEYNGYKISFKLNAIKCYPQDFAAVLVYKPKDNENSAVSYPTFYAVDIGGWTVDIVTVKNRRLEWDKCDSKGLGILAMYEKIGKDIEIKTGKRLSHNDMECILKGEKTLLKEEIVDAVKACASEWYKKIISSLVQFGLDLDTYPVLFVGGGALLFKRNIRTDKSITKYEFISSPRANAIGYATLLDAGR